MRHVLDGRRVHPADGFGAFIVALKARGFSDQDLDRMAKQNPATLLGLR